MCMTKFTHNEDVLVVWATNGFNVTITPVNKLARSKSIKWIRNGKKAKIRWKKKYKKGKYWFEATTQEGGDWLAGYYKFSINCT